MLILSWFKERFLSNTSYHSWVTRSATVAFLPSASVEPTHSLRGGVRQHCCTLGAFACVFEMSEMGCWYRSLAYTNSLPHQILSLGCGAILQCFPHFTRPPPLSDTALHSSQTLSLFEGLEGVGISGGSAKENRGQSCTGGPEKALSLAQGGLCWYLDLSTRDYISHWNYHYHGLSPEVCRQVPSSGVKSHHGMITALHAKWPRHLLTTKWTPFPVKSPIIAAWTHLRELIWPIGMDLP